MILRMDFTLHESIEDESLFLTQSYNDFFLKLKQMGPKYF